MQAIPLAEAQAHLGELIDRLSEEEPLVITRDNQPVAQLTLIKKPEPSPQFGSCKGMITIVSDDDEHLKDFAEYMP